MLGAPAPGLHSQAQLAGELLGFYAVDLFGADILAQRWQYRGEQAAGVRGIALAGGEGGEREVDEG